MGRSSKLWNDPEANGIRLLPPDPDCDCLVCDDDAVLTDLLPTGGTPNGSGDPLCVYVGQQVAGSQFKIGVRHQGIGTGATYTSGSWATAGTVNLFVVKYTFGSGGTVSLYVNPTPGGSEPAANVTVGPGGTEAANLQADRFFIYDFFVFLQDKSGSILAK